jgi:hypothetical protein
MLEGLLGDNFGDPRRQAMLGFAQGLLQGSSPSTTPVSLGGVLAPAIGGASQNYQKAVASAADLIKAQKAGSGGNSVPALIQEYQFAKSQGYDKSFMDFVASKRGGAGEYGLVPFYGTDEEGNTVMMQPGKAGEAITTKLPPGVKVQGKNEERIDAGTHVIIRDPLTRQTIAVIPKDVRGAAQEAAEGKVAGEKKAAVLFDLPTTVMQTETTLSRINELRNHPGKNVSLGVIQGRIPPVGGAQADFIERLEQLEGDAFLDAYATLKGGGAITEAEGLKAAKSRLRSSRLKSKEDFDAALTDYFRFLQKGMEAIHKKIGQTWNMPSHLSGSMIPGGGQIMGPGNIPPPPPGTRPWTPPQQ